MKKIISSRLYQFNLRIQCSILKFGSTYSFTRHTISSLTKGMTQTRTKNCPWCMVWKLSQITLRKTSLRWSKGANSVTLSFIWNFLSKTSKRRSFLCQTIRKMMIIRNKNNIKNPGISLILTHWKNLIYCCYQIQNLIQKMWRNSLQFLSLRILELSKANLWQWLTQRDSKTKHLSRLKWTSHMTNMWILTVLNSTTTLCLCTTSIVCPPESENLEQ